jgi:AraC-like DNA-binding protein
MFLTIIIAGQICLTVPVLFSRAKKHAVFLPLALFLMASGLLAMNSIVISLFPDWYALYTSLAFPALFFVCPSLWFYVEGMTANVHWTLHIKQAQHYMLLWPALVVSAMIFFLPNDIHTAIFIDDGDVTSPLAIIVVVSILVMMCLWFGQCVYSLLRIVNRLISYRKQMKDLYSNHEGRKLTWINWLLMITVCTWLFSLVSVFSSNLFDNFLFNIRTEVILSTLLIWSLAHFGLQQKPALFEHAQNDIFDKGHQEKNDTIDKEFDTQDPPQKYQRSALSTVQSGRIADKIKAAMRQDQLYADPNLSLQKLARYLAISPNYISQALNETLTVNFFDFVNQWRIEAAKPKILANQGTILSIALEVGFNARSSFYKAFKKEVGKTPSEYRKHGIHG